jgi:hypothetical protein
VDLTRPLTAVACIAATFVVVDSAQAAPAHKLVPPAWAKTHHIGTKQGALDRDKDGLTNWGEFRAGTNPRKRDSDRDGMSDALEDRDRDGIVNADEIAAGTDPRKRDSDGDRIPDGREDRDRDGLLNADERPSGHDLIKRDSDADGVLDGADNAGKVTAVSPTSVTIRRFVGGTLTASLSADSWIDCTTTVPLPVVATGSGTATSGTPTSSGSTGGSGGVGGVGDSDSSEEAGSGPDVPSGADPAPGVDSAPEPELETVEDDPARSAFLSPRASAAQVPEEEDAEAWDPAGEDSISPPDLGACAAALRVGAIVHKASLDGSTLSELELMKPVTAGR